MPKENANPLAAPRTKDACKRELVRSGVNLPTCDLKLAELQQLWRVHVAGEPDGQPISSPLQQPPVRGRARPSDAYRGQLDVLEARAHALGCAPVPLSVQAALADRLLPAREEQRHASFLASARHASLSPRPAYEREERSAPSVGVATPRSARHVVQARVHAASWQGHVLEQYEHEQEAEPAYAQQRRSSPPSRGAEYSSAREHSAPSRLPRCLLSSLIALALLALGVAMGASGQLSLEAAHHPALHIRQPAARPTLVAASLGVVDVPELTTSSASAQPPNTGSESEDAISVATPIKLEALGSRATTEEPQAAPQPALAQERDGVASSEHDSGGEGASTEDAVRTVSVPDKVLLLSALLLWRLLACCLTVGCAVLRAAFEMAVRLCGILLSLAWQSPILMLFTAALVLVTHGLRTLGCRWSGRKEREFIDGTSKRVVAELERYFGRISASSVYAPAVPCEDVRRSFSPTGRMNAEQLEKLWVRIEAQVEATSNFARTQSFLGAGGACMCWVPRRGAHADMITK